MSVYVAFLGHVQLPSVDHVRSHRRPEVHLDDLRVDHRPAMRRRERSQEA